MQEKTAPSSHETAIEPRLEVVKSSQPAAEAGIRTPDEPEETRRQRATVLQRLGKLKPLLPILTGGLRLVDHGAVQLVAQLLNFVESGTTTTQAAAESEELHHELSEIQTNHRQLGLQVQNQTVEMKRLEEQIALLREASERNAAAHAALVKDVRSLGHLVRVFGSALAILILVLIALTGVLFLHRT
jgi:hypothetical protein